MEQLDSRGFRLGFAGFVLFVRQLAHEKLRELGEF